jgi:hypothetical protein
LPQEDIAKVVRQTSFSFTRGGEAEKVGFWPMREGLGKRFGVVYSFSVVVRDMQLAVNSVCIKQKLKLSGDSVNLR